MKRGPGRIRTPTGKRTQDWTPCRGPRSTQHAVDVCGIFTVDPGWTEQSGYRAVVVADSTDGLSDPVALTFAEGAFNGRLFVVNQGEATLREVNVATGDVTLRVDAAAWGA